MRVTVFTQNLAINKIKYNKQKILFLPVFLQNRQRATGAASSGIKPKDALTGGTEMPSVRDFIWLWGQTLRATGGFDKWF